MILNSAPFLNFLPLKSSSPYPMIIPFPTPPLNPSLSGAVRERRAGFLSRRRRAAGEESYACDISGADFDSDVDMHVDEAVDGKEDPAFCADPWFAVPRLEARRGGIARCVERTVPSLEGGRSRGCGCGCGCGKVGGDGGGGGGGSYGQAGV